MTKEEVSITDLGIAAALITLDVPLKRIEGKEQYKKFIFFLETGEMKIFAAGYWANELQVSAYKYFLALRMLKARLRNFGT